MGNYTHTSQTARAGSISHHTGETSVNFKTKLLGVAVLPVILISMASFWVIQNESASLARTQISEVESRTMSDRRAEIKKMTRLAQTSLNGLLNDDTLSIEIAQNRAKKLLHNMAYGEDGYFFVYDQHGTNLVHPRLPNLVGKNWWNLQDPNGDFVIRNLIKVAKAGGGFHNYVWNKPSTGKLAPKIGHAIFLEKWGWMLGTGLYTDDVETEIAAMRTTLSSSIDRTKTVLLALTIAAILVAVIFTMLIRLSEQRFADQRLKELTNRIVEVQEDERKRVSTELHDGISQLLVSARYGLDRAQKRIELKTDASEALTKSMSIIENAISEVRRISMDLRPSVLDDIGLAAAVRALGRDFEESSGAIVHTATKKVGKRISENARTALYRVAQEALTNIAKHAHAEQVWMSIQPQKDEIILCIEDDGHLNLSSLRASQNAARNERHGMGLRNMRERMDAFQGSLIIEPSPKGGLKITARLPIEQNWYLVESSNSPQKDVHAA